MTTQLFQVEKEGTGKRANYPQKIICTHPVQEYSGKLQIEPFQNLFGVAVERLWLIFILKRC
jgi:hypothetical protein